MRWVSRFFNKISVLPPIVGWEMMPSLFVCIFGLSQNTPDIKYIEEAEKNYLKYYYGAEESSEALEAECDRLLAIKYQVLSIPTENERGYAGKHSALERERPKGEILLLVDGGATIKASDAKRVLNVLTEFRKERRLMLLQGRGYHAFVRRMIFSDHEFWFCRKGCLRDHSKRFGFISKRVDYLTIDPRRNFDYKW